MDSVSLFFFLARCLNSAGSGLKLLQTVWTQMIQQYKKLKKKWNSRPAELATQTMPELGYICRCCQHQTEQRPGSKVCKQSKLGFQAISVDYGNQDRMVGGSGAHQRREERVAWATSESWAGPADAWNASSSSLRMDSESHIGTNWILLKYNSHKLKNK